MNKEIENLLSKNGYRIYQRSELIVITRHLFISRKQYLIFLPGVIVLVFGLMLHSWLYPILSLFFISIGIITTSLPFFKYLIAAYRSLIIDFESQTLLFRSGYSRAHRFCDIDEMKIEYDNIQGKSCFLIIIYFVQDRKEELFELIMTDEDIDKRIFDIKDYFEARLKPRVSKFDKE